MPDTLIACDACADARAAGTCPPHCSIDVVDQLLSTADAVTGEEVDLLLDFRSMLRARMDAEATLRLFCELRRRIEGRHYLAFYRLRRWLENHIVATAQVSPSQAPWQVPLRLDHFCVEAVRRVCLCAALQQGSSARLDFAFVSLATSVRGPAAAESRACVG